MLPAVEESSEQLTFDLRPSMSMSIVMQSRPQQIIGDVSKKIIVTFQPSAIECLKKRRSDEATERRRGEGANVCAGCFAPWRCSETQFANSQQPTANSQQPTANSQ